jgi:hypothetical protein
MSAQPPLFTHKDCIVEWEKVDRATPLVEAAFSSGDANTAAKARRLEHFYSHLVRWRVGDGGASEEDMVKLFRLTQLVMEARTMLFEEALDAAVSDEVGIPSFLLLLLQKTTSETARNFAMSHGLELGSRSAFF